METKHTFIPATVKFVGDYFVMTISVTVSVDADEDLHSGEIQDRAVDLANEVLYDHYGWQDVDSVSNQVEVELREGY